MIISVMYKYYHSKIEDTLEISILDEKYNILQAFLLLLFFYIIIYLLLCYSQSYYLFVIELLSVSLIIYLLFCYSQFLTP